MSKILALAEEIDKEFHAQEEQIKNLRSHAEYLENELDKEKTRNSEFRKDLMQLLSKYSSDEWHSW
jgi:Skp family chaperone for outer membrane proteins